MTVQDTPPLQRHFWMVGVWFWAVLLGSLLPWLYFRSGQAANPDILWLCEALQRLLNGDTLSEAAYELNPPLNIFIYLPPVLAKSWLGVPLHYGVFLYTLLLTGLSALAGFKIMRGWGFLGRKDAHIITAGYLLAVTVGASIYFGERDHLIALALMPFVLAQLTLTFRWKQAKGWIGPVLAIGAVFILLKPHHGLLPTLLLLHRLALQRRFSIVLDRDFLSLAVASLAYLILTPLFFPDYVSVILPDVIRLYLPMGDWEAVKKGAAFIAITAEILLVVTLLLKLPLQHKLFAGFLLFAATISIIPYVVQGMGLYYHIIPAFAFLGAAIGFILLGWLRQQLAPRETALFLALIILISFSHLYAPLNIHYPRHEDFAKTELARILPDCRRQEDCSFFIFNREMGLIHETAHYNGITHASRFPSLWFLGELLHQQKKIDKGEPSRLSEEEAGAFFEKFAGYLAEDLNRYKPQTVLIWKWGADFYPTSFVDYFGKNPKFDRAWAAYRKTGAIELNYADYYKATHVDNQKMLYDIYERTGE